LAHEIGTGRADSIHEQQNSPTAELVAAPVPPQLAMSGRERLKELKEIAWAIERQWLAIQHDFDQCGGKRIEDSRFPGPGQNVGIGTISRDIGGVSGSGNTDQVQRDE
jgi:hypothetical protein